uniref:Predicted protein n=1 Tax=Hordeum vulgare subsp. vulgare TaxID=112509 RepID=F2DE44_HORVV|nr:predicted protein [Hordeum vulgare subsp. vulgare]
MGERRLRLPVKPRSFSRRILFCSAGGHWQPVARASGRRRSSTPGCCTR